jgi:hypothetical protein
VVPGETLGRRVAALYGLHFEPIMQIEEAQSVAAAPAPSRPGSFAISLCLLSFQSLTERVSEENRRETHLSSLYLDFANSSNNGPPYHRFTNPKQCNNKKNTADDLYSQEYVSATRRTAHFSSKRSPLPRPQIVYAQAVNPSRLNRQNLVTHACHAAC